MERAALGVLVLAAVAAGCASAPPPDRVSRVSGPPAPLGDGVVASYAEFGEGGAPKAIGLAIAAASLASLPSAPSDGHHCYDADGDGAIDLAHECAGWHERVLPLPAEANARADIPFKWVLLNWNPHGHIPPGVYDTPHFDVHFYLDSIENTFAIQAGPCGPEHVRCDQFAQARLPVPEGHMHPDFRDVQAVAPAMGNHLIDPSAPEFHGQRFDRTWIYGVYGGRVTFYEEMVTVRYLQSRPDACHPIKAPSRVAKSGYYPTRSCIRYDASRAAYAVSLEGFERRQGSG